MATAANSVRGKSGGSEKQENSRKAASNPRSAQSASSSKTSQNEGRTGSATQAQKRATTASPKRAPARKSKTTGSSSAQTAQTNSKPQQRAHASVLLGPGATSGAVSTLLPTAGNVPPLPSVNDAGSVLDGLKSGVEKASSAVQNFFSSFDTSSTSNPNPTPPGVGASTDLNSQPAPQNTGDASSGNIQSSTGDIQAGAPTWSLKTWTSKLLRTTKYRVNGKDKIFGFQLGQNMSRQLASRAKKGENRDLLFLQPLEIAKKVDEVLRPTYIGTHDHIQTNNFPEGESFSGKALNAQMAVTLKHSSIANLLTNPLMTDATELVALNKHNERMLQSRARTNPDFKPGDDELYSVIAIAKGEKENKHNKQRDEDLEALKDSKGKSMYGQFLREAFQVMPLFHGDGTEGHPGFNGQFFKLLPGARSQLGNTGGPEIWGVDPKNPYTTGLYSVNWTKTALLNDGATLAATLKKAGRPREAVAQVNLTDTRVLADGVEPRDDLERIIPATGEPLKSSIFMGMWSEKNLGHLNPNPTIGSNGKPKPFIPWTADFRNYFSIESPADMKKVKANTKADMDVKLSDPVIARKVDEEITNSILVGDKNRLVEEVSEFFKRTNVDGVSFRVNTELMSSIDGLVNTFDTYRTNR